MSLRNLILLPLEKKGGLNIPKRLDDFEDLKKALIRLDFYLFFKLILHI